MPALTVYQSLKFTALLRLPGTMTREEKLEKVDEVIAMLRLNKSQRTKIGTVDLRGISGGERKRLCIASELLADPAIIFFDEPTSGLDSSMALVVARSMKELAKDNQLTLVTTIHQPNSQVFGQFDKLLLLDEGHTIFNGASVDAVSYFTKIGHPCPDGFNPPNFLMDLIVLRALTEEHRKVLTADFMPAIIVNDTDKSALEEVEVEKPKIETETYPISYIDQVTLLTQRQMIVILDGFFDKETVFLYAGLAGIAGLLWARLGYGEETIFPRYGLAL